GQALGLEQLYVIDVDGHAYSPGIKNPLGAGWGVRWLWLWIGFRLWLWFRHRRRCHRHQAQGDVIDAVSRWVGLTEYWLRSQRRTIAAVPDHMELPSVRQRQQHHPAQLIAHGLQLPDHGQGRPCPAVAAQLDLPAVELDPFLNQQCPGE